MGQKVNPNSLRLGVNKNWASRWNAPNRKMESKWLLEDEKVRNLIKTRCRSCGVSHVEIERLINLNEITIVNIYVYMSQIGLFISNEKEISLINKELRKILGRNIIVKLDPRSLENPAVSAEILGQEVVDAIQARSPHRVVIKRAIRRAMTSGALGIKIKISGRINGVEIARNEVYVDGSVPLSTLRADIDYSFQTAKTAYGILGVKVWVNRGLYFGKYFMALPPAPKAIAWKSKDSNKYISNTY